MKIYNSSLVCPENVSYFLLKVSVRSEHPKPHPVGACPRDLLPVVIGVIVAGTNEYQNYPVPNTAESSIDPFLTETFRGKNDC